MPKTLIKLRLHSNKHKPKIKQEVNNTKSNVPPNLQPFKQKLFSGNGFVEYKKAILVDIIRHGYIVKFYCI